MAEVKWIKIVTDMFNNRKIKQIRKLPEGDAIIVIWLQLLCLAGQTNFNGMVYFSQDIPYTDEMLSIEFDRPINLIRLALKTFESFGMIEIIDDVLLVSNWEKYQSADKLEEIREQNRIRQQKFREKQKQLAESNVTETLQITQRNGTDIDIEEDIDIDKDKKHISKKDIDNFFEAIWKTYPKKEGKGSISDTQKKKLYNIGLDEMIRAVERYKKAKVATEKKYLQMGSTFFNSGYVDYLDCNYVQEKENKPRYEDKNPFLNGR